MGALVSRRDLLAGTATVGSAALAIRLGIGSAAAQSYPAQAIRWIIYQSPGGLIDGSTRAIQPYLKEQGFQTEIEYVRGASGRIARTQLFRAPPDGYMIMTEAGPEEILGEVVYGANYKVAQFQPVFGWFINAFNIYALKDSPIKSFEDFVKEAKSRKVTIGTLGKGGPSHLQLAILRRKLGLNLQLVHFEGGAPAFAAVQGGHIETAIGGSSSNRWVDVVNFLGVFRDGRDPALPEVPTVAELGYDVTPINEVIYANAAPGVPADRIAKLADAFATAFKNPEHIKQQQSLGVYPKLMSATEIRQIVQTRYPLVEENKSELAG